MNKQKQLILEYAQNNFGAIDFLLSLQYEPLNKSQVIWAKIREAKTIRGTNLYVLYSDLCNKDMRTVLRLCTVCPTDVLEDACSRQDYSGRELVRKYLI